VGEAACHLIAAALVLLDITTLDAAVMRIPGFAQFNKRQSGEL
jgi:hypothetical protein